VAYLEQYYSKIYYVKKKDADDSKNKYAFFGIGFKIYKGEHKPIEQLENEFIKPFFHEKRDYLWNLLKRVDQEPEFFHRAGQPARASYLLYGPPGSGKSSFIYRIARALKRHIVSVDLMDIHEKKDLYSLFHNPKVAYRNDPWNYYSIKPKKTIIVLEEIDNAIRKLKNIEMRSVQKKRQKILRKQKKKEMKLQKSLKKKLKKDIKNEIKKDNNKESDVDTSDSDSDSDDDDLDPISGCMSYTDSDEYYDYNAHDLLDILQGTVPVEGLIVIATTNDYKYIKKVCPALVRHGRLSPIEFNYMTQKTFDDMCMYHFKQTFEIPKSIDIEKIPTSLLVEEMLRCKNDVEHEITLFSNFIRDLKYPNENNEDTSSLQGSLSDPLLPPVLLDISKVLDTPKKIIL